MDEQTKIFMTISQQLGEISASMKNVLEKLADHEHRLDVIEGKKCSDWKTELLMLLAKAVLVGGVSIGSLVGAGSMLEKMFR